MEAEQGDHGAFTFSASCRRSKHHHVVLPLTPAKAVFASDLIGDNGWLEVDKITLQYKRYPNIFGIGDICGIPMRKTGGSFRHRGPIVTQNVISYLKGEKPKAKFDGYTVCPLKTQYGKIIMAEFNYATKVPHRRCRFYRMKIQAGCGGRLICIC